MENQLRPPQQFAYPTPPEVQETTTRELASAAFRQENDVYNAIQLFTKDKRPPADPNFDFVENATKSKYWSQYPSKLAKAQSLQELQMIEAQIEQEEADRQLIASQGMAGFAWAMGAAMASPTIAIPLVGQARGALGIGQAFGLAAIAATAAEAPLFANQLTRTPTESMIGIAGGTVLGGLLGSAAVMMRKGDFDRVANEIGPVPATQTAIVAGQNGALVRVGNEMPLQGIAGSPRSAAFDTEISQIRNSILFDLEGVEVFDGRIWEAVTEGGYIADRYKALGINSEADLERLVRDPDAFKPTTAQITAYLKTLQIDNSGIAPRASRFSTQYIDGNESLAAVQARLDEANTTGRMLSEVAEDQQVPDNIFARRRVAEEVDDLRNAAADYRLDATPTLSDFRSVFSEIEGVDDIIMKKLMDAVERIGPRAFNEAVDKGTPPSSAFERVLIQVIDEVKDDTFGRIELRERLASDAEFNKTIEDRIVAVEQANSVGAKARQDQFMPMIRTVDEDGVETFEPMFDADGPIDPGKMAPATFVGRVASATSPILRAINQFDQPVPAAETRRIFQQLSDSGVSMEGNVRGIATTAEGTVEHRLGYYQGLLGNFYRFQHDQYLKYAYGEIPTGPKRLAANMLMETGRAPRGKLSFLEFKERVADAANLGDKSDIPEVQATAGNLRSEFYAKIHDAADEAADFTGGKRLYQFFDPKNEDESYMRHQFAPEKVAERRMEFIEDVAKHYEEVLTTTFGRRVDKAIAKADIEAKYEDILRMSQDEAQKLYDELGEQLAGMKEPDSIRDMLDVVRATRAEARQLYDEAFLRLEKSNVNEDPVVTRDNKRLAREEVAEEREALLAKADYEEALLPTPVRERKTSRKKLQQMRRMLNESMGRLEARQAETLAKIEANDEANIANFERVVRGTQKFLRDSARATDEVLDQQLVSVKKQLDLATKRFGSNRIAQERLIREDPNSEPLAQLELQEAELGDRLFARSQQFEQLSTMDREAKRALIRGTLDDAIALTNRVNSKRSERNAMLRQKAKDLDPAQVTAKIEGMRNRQLERFEELEDQLQGAGATDINARLGRFSFAETARDIATDLQNKIAGNVSRIAQIDTMASLRSPMQRRVLNIPYDIKRKYLELDTEKVVTRYARTMGSDIELYRATGSVNGANAARAINEEFMKLKDYLQTREVDEKGKKITDAQRTKQLVQMNKAHKKRLQEFDATIERIRGIRGVPKDPSGMSYRMGRLFLNMNTASMMGSAAITSIPDASRAVMAHGMMRTFGKSWMPFISGLVDESQKEINQQMVKQLRLFGIGNDVYTGTRARGTFDIAGADFGNQTAVERFFDFAAAKTPQVALFGPWTDYMKQMTAAATMSRFFSAIDDLNTGNIRPEDLEYLTQASISPAMARRIQAQMDKTGTRYKDTIIPNVEKWDDYAAMRAFHAAMSREDARLVISPGLEKPLWMDATMLGRVVGQFRSFTFAANTKILVSGLQQRNMAAAYALQGTAFSLALGAVSYYIWAMTSGERARKEMQEAGWETWLDQAIYRSGILGAFSEVQSIGSEIPATRPFVTFGDDELAGRRANSVLGAIAGPTFGKSEDIASLLVGIDDPTEATVAQARKLLPWQNVFYLREALTQVEEGTANLLNLQERRQ